MSETRMPGSDIPHSDPIWEKSPQVLSLGYRIEEGSLILEHPAWWGVTVGMQTFAVRGLSGTEAVAKVASELGQSPDDIIADWHLYPDVYHNMFLNEDANPHHELDERYPDQDVARVIPFTIREWTEGPRVTII